MRRYILLLASAAVMAAGCQSSCEDGIQFMDYASFEDDRVEMTFHAGNDSMLCDEVDNPKREGLNTTARCGRVISGGGENEFIWSEPFGRNFDFTANPPVFKMLVLAPEAGARVWMKLEPESFNSGIAAVLHTKVLNTRIPAPHVLIDSSYSRVGTVICRAGAIRLPAAYCRGYLSKTHVRYNVKRHN